MVGNFEAEVKSLNELRTFSACAPETFTPGEKIKRHELPNAEIVSCIRWNEEFSMSGADILRCVVYRFEAFGREVVNRAKFEELVFSDLRSSKTNVRARLEEGKSEMLEFLHKYGCIRTKKKQRVFYWYAIPHDRLFLESSERELRRAVIDDAHSDGHRITVAVREPALSMSYDPMQKVVHQINRIMLETPPNQREILSAVFGLKPSDFRQKIPQEIQADGYQGYHRQQFQPPPLIASCPPTAIQSSGSSNMDIPRSTSYASVGAYPSDKNYVGNYNFNNQSHHMHDNNTINHDDYNNRNNHHNTGTRISDSVGGPTMMGPIMDGNHTMNRQVSDNNYQPAGADASNPAIRAAATVAAAASSTKKNELAAYSVSYRVRDDPTNASSGSSNEDQSNLRPSSNCENRRLELDHDVSNTDLRSPMISDSHSGQNVRLPSIRDALPPHAQLDLFALPQRTVSDKNQQQTMPDGNQQQNMPDGYQQQNMPDGYQHQNSPDGYQQQNMPDGYQQRNLPDGNQLRTMPDGDQQQNMPDGNQKQSMPDGNQKGK